MSCWDEDPDKRPSFEALQTELLQLIGGGLHVSSVSSITTDPNYDVCLSVDEQTAGFSNYQNASTIPLEISKQNTKGRDQVRAYVNDEIGVMPIFNFSERKTILNVFITIPACYSQKDRSEPMPVAQSHQGLHRHFS
ncbi:unnamed protein product [Lymnaea stagnalis]|uniref:Uncharacterized protein n=1 Tax=Lymnaea stagnalis TaxID=6523 RepID=A0AAV2H7S1_LYMST